MAAGTGYHDAGTSGNWQTFGRRTPMRILGHLLGIVAAAIVALPVAANAQAKLDGRTPQVLIESNLIETTPTFARSLGIRLQFTNNGATFSSVAGG